MSPATPAQYLLVSNGFGGRVPVSKSREHAQQLLNAVVFRNESLLNKVISLPEFLTVPSGTPVSLVSGTDVYEVVIAAGDYQGETVFVYK